MSLKTIFCLIACVAATPAAIAMQNGGKAPVQDVWQPAKTPPGGTPWKLLEQTRLMDRTDKASGIIYTKPAFTPAVRALAGKKVTVSGWMMPLETSAHQKHFVLLGYPPGCPFHFHAMPNQFIEVYSAVPVKTDESKLLVISGVLELTGQDESGIFYRIRNARPG